MDLNAIVQALRVRPAETRLLLLMDFDGTLVELAHDPDAVELSSARRGVLQRLVRRSDLTIGVISGRRVADLRVKVGAGDTLYYAGLHGLEIEGPGMQFRHNDAAHSRSLIREIGRSLLDATKDLAGVRVEDKELTVAMHVRGAAPAVQRQAALAFRRIAESHVSAGMLRELRGNQVFELLPAVAWTKGTAVLHIKADVERQYRQAVWPIYLGNDVTDEDAFRAVGPEGMTIAVGDRPASAAFRLFTPDAVERFLRQLTLTGP